MNDLLLHEQLLLLALRDDKGTVEAGATMYAYALGGAIFAELLLADRIRVDDDAKKPLVNVVSSKSMRDPVLDECLQKIADAKRRARARAWVGRFAQLGRLRHRVAEGLCRKGVLKDSEDKVLLIFTRKIYPTTDPRPERRLIKSMRDAIFGSSRKFDPRLAVLIALANGTGLLRLHFDKRQLRERKARIEEITSGELVGAATKAATAAAQQAVQAAMMAAVAVSIATSGH